MSTEDAQLLHVTFHVRLGCPRLRTHYERRFFDVTFSRLTHGIRLIHEFATGIETITRQPLQMAHRSCNCWLFCISN